jgi:hypothetical protein
MQIRDETMRPRPAASLVFPKCTLWLRIVYREKPVATFSHDALLPREAALFWNADILPTARRHAILMSRRACDPASFAASAVAFARCAPRAARSRVGPSRHRNGADQNGRKNQFPKNRFCKNDF